MITQLTVEGYQSIGNDTLDLAPVTLVVGKNYSGKSALANRALLALATNQTGDEFIKQGAKQALVSVTLDDGHIITWTKTKGKGGEYDLDGRTFTKTAGQVPEEIQEALGIRPIVIDDQFSLFPQIQRQWDPPFLVGESGSRIARALGKLTKIDVIVSAQMSTRKKRDRHGKARDTEEELHGRLSEQREALPPVEELRGDLNLIQSSIERAKGLEENITAVRALTAELRSAQSVVAIDLDPVRGKVEAAEVLVASLVQTERVKHLQLARTKALNELTRVQEMLTVDLEPVRKAHASAVLQLSKVVTARALIHDRRTQQKTLEGAAEGVIRAAGNVEAARERHKAECTRIGVCDSCPFVEAV